ncbi:hypothetical protein [Actinoalloteichus sp. GBA129-24]|uniref:hypothetical protein n=1 Tax=Actinoalloteichus sp. GBA129-24 TaxID=1612551 RepID=UPI0009506D7E|nr:hypothetical protein [Actinoalloteichus sp. GBA129-24]APU19504.1 hypothetical protein UA75_07425 [Actinoalloteichus sp. GBA129-24]
MSVTDVVAQLRQAHALLTAARLATAQADAAIVDGAMIFAAATASSTQSEVAGIADLARLSSEDVRTADALFAQTQALIDTYCHDIAGVGAEPVVGGGDLATAGESLRPGASMGPALSVAKPESESGESPGPEVRYAGWIAELRRAKAKVSPDKILRMTRHRNGHLVWLEAGSERAGLRHILRPKREGNFEDKGISADCIVDLIFAGIDRGTLVGYIGEDREVYDVEFDGRVQRVAVAIADNGFIITAHPMHDYQKVRPTIAREF